MKKPIIYISDLKILDKPNIKVGEGFTHKVLLNIFDSLPGIESTQDNLYPPYNDEDNLRYRVKFEPGSDYYKVVYGTQEPISYIVYERFCTEAECLEILNWFLTLSEEDVLLGHEHYKASMGEQGLSNKNLKFFPKK